MLGFPVFVPPLVQVQEEGRYGDDGNDFGNDDTMEDSRTSPSAVAKAARAGKKVADSIEAATQFCRQLPDASYAIDCMAYELWEIQKSLPDSGEFADVKKVIADTSKQLRELAEDNQSRSKRPNSGLQGQPHFLTCHCSG